MRRRREPGLDGDHSHPTRYTAADFQSALHGPEPRMEELAYLRALLDRPEALLSQAQSMTGIVYTEHGPLEVVETKPRPTLLALSPMM